MKIVAIQGSFRKNGITSTMLNYAVDKAKALGHEVKLINLHEKNIKFCKGCRKCFENYGCIFKDDDIEVITKDIKAADVIFIATPTYWANVPGIVKNLFDRLTGAAMEETEGFPKPRLSGKRYVLFTACNTVSPFSHLAGQIPGLNRSVREFFKTSGVRCLGKVTVCNTGKVKNVPEKRLKKIDKLVSRI